MFEQLFGFFYINILKKILIELAVLDLHTKVRAECQISFSLLTFISFSTETLMVTQNQHTG